MRRHSGAESRRDADQLGMYAELTRSRRRPERDTTFAQRTRREAAGRAMNAAIAAEHGVRTLVEADRAKPRDVVLDPPDNTIGGTSPQVSAPRLWSAPNHRVASAPQGDRRSGYVLCMCTPVLLRTVGQSTLRPEGPLPGNPSPADHRARRVNSLGTPSLTVPGVVPNSRDTSLAPRSRPRCSEPSVRTSVARNFREIAR